MITLYIHSHVHYNLHADISKATYLGLPLIQPSQMLKSTSSCTSSLSDLSPPVQGENTNFIVLLTRLSGGVCSANYLHSARQNAILSSFSFSCSCYLWSYYHHYHCHLLRDHDWNHCRKTSMILLSLYYPLVLVVNVSPVPVAVAVVSSP